MSPPTDPQSAPPGELTTLLRAFGEGDAEAGEQLFSLVYARLHGLAEHYMGNGAGHTLQPTALVHEAFARVVQLDSPDWSDREHFFAVVARAIRHALVDYNRAKRRVRRGEGRMNIGLEKVTAHFVEQGIDVVEVHDALEDLERFDPKLAQIVNLRFFLGLEMTEVARIVRMSQRTAERKWALARAWLRDRLAGDGDGAS